MPETPNLEAIAGFLAPRLADNPVARIDAPVPWLVRTGIEALGTLVGHALTGIRGHDKFLLFATDDARLLVVNPMLTGRFHWAEPAERRRAYTGLVFGFTDDHQLSYSDQRRMGRWYLVPHDALDTVPQFAELGPDALAIDEESFLARLRRHPGQIKSVLTNQQVLADITNAYSDEILWAARLHPHRRRATMSVEELRGLYHTMRETLDWARPILEQEVAERLYQENNEWCAHLRVHPAPASPARAAATRSPARPAAEARPTTVCTASRSRSDLHAFRGRRSARGCAPRSRRGGRRPAAPSSAAPSCILRRRGSDAHSPTQYRSRRQLPTYRPGSTTMKVLGRDIDDRVDPMYREIAGRVGTQTNRELRILGDEGGELSHVKWAAKTVTIALHSGIPTHALPHALAVALQHVRQTLDGYPLVRKPAGRQPQGADLVRGALRELVLEPDAEVAVAPLGLDREWEHEQRHQAMKDLLKDPPEDWDTEGALGCDFIALQMARLELSHPPQMYEALRKRVDQVLPVAAHRARVAGLALRRKRWGTPRAAFESLVNVRDELGLGDIATIEDARSKQTF